MTDEAQHVNQVDPVPQELGPEVRRIPGRNSAWVTVVDLPDFKGLTTYDSIMKRVQRNTRECRIVEIDGVPIPTVRTRVFGLAGNYFVINRHAVLCKTRFVVKISNVGEFSTSEEHFTRVYVTPANVVHLGDIGDIFLFTADSVNCVNVLNYLLDDFPYDRPVEGRIVGHKVVARRELATRIVKSRSENVLIDPFLYEWKQHYASVCGTPLVLNPCGDKWAIAGIHSAGSSSGDGCGATFLRKTLVEAGIRQLS